QLQEDLAALPPGRGRPGIEDEIHPLLLQCLFQRLAHVGVLARQELTAAVDDGDPAAEAAEHLPELQADVPAAQDEQVLRQLSQLEDALVGQVADPVEPRDGWDGWPGAGVDEDALALQLLLADAEAVRPDEARVPAEKVQVRVLLHLALHPGAPLA